MISEYKHFIFCSQYNSADEDSSNADTLKENQDISELSKPDTLKLDTRKSEVCCLVCQYKQSENTFELSTSC